MNDTPRELSASAALPAAATPSRALRWLLVGLGFAFVGLAALGVVLPGLPTTPLLLVAAACFARSSPRFYAWLLSNRVFGPLIREWRETRTMPFGAKVWAIALIVTVGGSSVVFLLASPWARVAVGAILVGLVAWLLHIPTAVRSDARE